MKILLACWRLFPFCIALLPLLGEPCFSCESGTWLIFFWYEAASVLGATITLYDIVDPDSFRTPDPSLFPKFSAGFEFTISPVSTNSNGKTVYEEIGVITAEFVIQPSTTVLDTSLSLPRTVTCEVQFISECLFDLMSRFSFLSVPVGTFVEDATAVDWLLSFPGHPPDIATESCIFQGTTAGICVNPNIERDSFNTAHSTSFSTFTGVRTPIFTITQSSGTRIAAWNDGSIWGIGCAISLTTAVVVARLTWGI